MSEKLKQKQGVVEKGLRFGRDFNIVVGSVALAGALIAPPALAIGLGAYAGINYAQAAGFEFFRKKSDKKSKKKKSSK